MSEDEPTPEAAGTRDDRSGPPGSGTGAATPRPSDPTDTQAEVDAAGEAVTPADADPVEPTGTPPPTSDDEIVDELPEDLNLTEFVGPHTFPNNNRRRIPAAMYIVIGIGCIAVFAAYDGSSALVNTGILAAGIGLLLFGGYGMVAGWTLRVDESDALVTASAQVGFAVGHASAQQVWHGWLSRPTWRILLYSAENPPHRRGIVLIDGMSGEVLEWFSEENPENWEGLDPSRTALSGD